MTIPIEVFDQHAGIVGKVGSGKTYAAKGVVESLIDLKRRVCVIDPTGAWWGLRLLRDGKARGYPVIVCGGDYGDIEIDEAMAKPLAAAIARSDTPMVIDLSGFSDAAAHRFMTAFLAQLRRDNTAPLHLIIDEADMFAPQQPMRDQAQMLHQMNQVVRRGRIRGLRVMLISQRPAVIHKDVLTQINSLIAMRMTGPQDRNAIKAWIEYQADASLAKDILSSLATLPTGDGWVWAPEHDLLKRIAFPAIKTFDSSAAPEHGNAKLKIEFAPIDIAMLRASLEKAGVQIKENDPAALRAKMADLERKLKAASATVPPPPVIEKAIREKAWQEGYDAADETWRKRIGCVTENAITLVEAAANHYVLLQSHGEKKVYAPAPVPARSVPARVAPAPPSAETGTITGPQQNLLSALAWWESVGTMQPTRPMIAVIAGWSIKSSNVTNVLGSCRTLGLVEYPSVGLVALTDAGRALAPPADSAISFLEQLRRVVSGPQMRVINSLLSNGKMTRENLADAVGWSRASSNVTNVLGALRTLNIVGYPDRGTVDLTPWVREQAK